MVPWPPSPPSPVVAEAGTAGAAGSGSTQGNGISVAVAEPALKGEPFILSMSDHIVPEDALRRIVEAPGKYNLLLVDKQIDKIFDIDDATKVALDGSRIIDSHT